MKILNQYLYLFEIYIIGLYFYIKVYSKEIIIHNKSENFYNIQDIINNNQDDNILIVRLVDDHYDMSDMGFCMELSIISDVIILGNTNGTILDFNYSKKGQIRFNYSSNNSVRLENLIFQHYSTNHELVHGSQIIYIYSPTNKVQFNMHSCIFRDNDFRLIQYDISSANQIQSYAQSTISNCTFM